MLEALKRFVLEFLKVPAEPSVPAGSGEPRVFRAAPAYYRYRLLVWALKQFGAACALIAGFVALAFTTRNVEQTSLVMALRLLEGLAWLGFVFQLPFSFAVLHLDFEMRWYILSDRSLRIREGILSLREKTMTFANIQDIEVRQNPLQRILGIADVQVRTAGGGSPGGGSDPHAAMGEPMHQARFSGVDNAQEIRNAIAERVRAQKDTGLGDPDDVHSPAGGNAVTEAARYLGEEARLLRLSLNVAPE